MSGHVTLNRLSLVQLHSEERKQQAHLKKLAEIKRRGGFNNTKSGYLPRVHHSNATQANEKNKEIMKENDAKLKKILNIMQSKAPLTPPLHPTNSNGRLHSLQLSQNNTDYLGRIAKIKGVYDVREWKKEFEEHKEHLKISKDNKLFTPIGVNRQRVRANSITGSKRTTPTASTNNLGQQFDNNN